MERRMVDTTICPMCLMQFHTRTRVVEHLAKDNHRCRAALSLTPPLLTVEQAAALDEAEAHRRRQLRAFDPLTRLPAHRVAGPRPRAFAEGAGAAEAAQEAA